MVEQRKIRPTRGPVDAVVQVPGSKSIANRALICAALADGRSTLRALPDGDDTVAMLACLDTLGIAAEIGEDRTSIVGMGGTFRPTATELHAGLAGTTSRFITAVAALVGTPVTIDGHPPLRARPFAPLHEALRQLGVDVTTDAGEGDLPAVVHGPPLAKAVHIRGDVSSQYISALMLIGPSMGDGIRIELTTELVSRPYVELTAAVMSWFGIEGTTITDRLVEVPKGPYLPASVVIEPDASSASYPLAVAAIVGGSVTVPGLGHSALQGDARFAELIERMGCTVERTADSVRVERDPRRSLTGIDVDMSDISDLVPTVAVVAAVAGGTTRITGVGFIRGKESDRIGDLAGELRKLGVRVDETDDGLIIMPSRDRLHGAVVGTHHDHRLAMAFAVIGSVIDGVVVEHPGVVDKSWPAFWTMLDEAFT